MLINGMAEFAKVLQHGISFPRPSQNNGSQAACLQLCVLTLHVFYNVAEFHF